ncbi:MAG: family 1 glycosylhydrolase, partial [Candidatus Omnitrophica bacterium]|nr:family 1 glycosylhydrolase [Candidatus Omnitrophota bacterium]
RSFFAASAVTDNLLFAHVRSYRLIHDIYKKNGFGLPFISVAKNMQAFEPCRDIFKDKLAAYLRSRSFNFRFIERARRRKALDFIGINYYSRSLVEVGKWSIDSLINDTCQKGHKPLKKNSLGWDIYPEGLYKLLLRLKKFRLPVFILENGFCGQDDALRWEYIKKHLENIHLAISGGVNIIGYLYWSLMDNFEWDKGFGHRFGLVRVDYLDQKRAPRESAGKFAAVCLRGQLE